MDVWNAEPNKSSTAASKDGTHFQQLKSDFGSSYIPVRNGADRPRCYINSLMRYLLMHISSSSLNISSFFFFFILTEKHVRSVSLLNSIRVTSFEAIKSRCKFLGFCRDAAVISTFNRLKPTGYMTHQQVQNSTTVRSAHTVFMCFVFIWEQTATCATYSINWLGFITQMKSVYSAVRTGSLNKAVCASSFKG